MGGTSPKEGMMKKLIAVAVLGFAVSAMAQTTAQFGSDVTIKAVKNPDGSATVFWNGPIKVLRAEHYVGHGKDGGFIVKIPAGDARQVTLKDIAKNGGRFQLFTTEDKPTHIECGNNSSTVMPTTENVGFDCSHVMGGQNVGAWFVK